MKLFKRLTALFVVMFAFVAIVGLTAFASSNSVEVYKKVTDESQLAAGDTIIITKPDATYALSTVQNKNNRGAVAISTESDGTILKENLDSTVQVITLEAGTNDGSWAFNVDGKYLYAASGSSNHLKTQDSKDANASFKITFADGEISSVVAQGTNSRNILKFNPNNGSPIFSCYGSTTSVEGSISIYKLSVEESSAVVLENPSNLVVEGTVATWDAVENAEGYKLGIFESEDSTGAVAEFESTEASYTFKYLPNGTYYVKVKAVGDNENYLSSDYSEAISVTSDATYTISVTEFFEIPAGLNDSVKCTVTGVISGFYTNYNKVEENNYDAGYNNVSFYITDGDTEVICYRVKGDNAALLAVGDTVTVTGTVNNYSSKNQFPKDSTFDNLRRSSVVALGYQVSELDAENNTVSLRLLAGLNAEYADVEALSLVIEGAKENDALKLTTVYDKIIADTENGIDEFTAEELGFKYLSALTITDVPTGAALTVTISYTTAAGTFQSVTKTYTVNADGTVTVA